MKNNLLVKIDKKQSGILAYEDGEYIFSYDTKDKSDFVSLTMPIRNKSWDSKLLHPIFEMHLPEG